MLVGVIYIERVHMVILLNTEQSFYQMNGTIKVQWEDHLQGFNTGTLRLILWMLNKTLQTRAKIIIILIRNTSFIGQYQNIFHQIITA